RLQEEHTRGDVALAQLFHGGQQILGEGQGAYVHHHRHTRHGAVGASGQLDHRGQQSRRQVVHHEPVQVLQCPSSRAPSRTGHTGDDDHLGRQVPTQFDHHLFPPPSVLCCAAVSPRPSERSPVRCACTASASFGPIPGTAAISSTVAEDSRFTEPNSLIS